MGSTIGKICNPREEESKKPIELQNNPKIRKKDNSISKNSIQPIKVDQTHEDGGKRESSNLKLGKDLGAVGGRHKSGRGIQKSKSNGCLSRTLGLREAHCEDDFEFHNIIGIGGFGRVFLAHKKTDPTVLYAIKVISKKLIKEKSSDQIMNEVRILSLISEEDCLLLTKMICSFQSKHNLYFCLEYVPGGNLRGYLLKMGPMSPDVVAFVVGQVLLALEYLHCKLNIIHRDLKPENILIDANGNCKVTDFGLSKMGKIEAFSFCGTFNYIAPELIKKTGYTRMIDFWMLGCLAYELLVGKPPFNHKNKKTLFDSITSACYKSSEIKDPVSRDFVGKLLVTSPLTRLGAGGVKQIKGHPFFKGINFHKLGHLQLKSPLKEHVITQEYVDIINNPSNGMEAESPCLHLDNFSWLQKEAFLTNELRGE